MQGLKEPDVVALGGAKRVLVIGPSGSGKTHLALRIAPLLELPVIHLDAHRWRPGWVPVPDAEWRPMAAALARRPAWVMDGTYESTLDLRIPAADVVILMERGRAGCLCGAVERTVLPWRRPGPGAPPPQPLDRGLLHYLWSYNVDSRPLVIEQLREHGDTTVIAVHSRREANGLVRALAQRITSPRSADAQPDGGHDLPPPPLPVGQGEPSAADAAMADGSPVPT